MSNHRNPVLWRRLGYYFLLGRDMTLIYLIPMRHAMHSLRPGGATASRARFRQ